MREDPADKLCELPSGSSCNRRGRRVEAGARLPSYRPRPACSYFSIYSLTHVKLQAINTCANSDGGKEMGCDHLHPDAGCVQRRRCASRAEQSRLTVSFIGGAGGGGGGSGGSSRSSGIFAYLERNVIGRETRFNGPYGSRKLLYFDFVASGRSLRCIEDYIRTAVLPFYGNTHSSGSAVSLQTTRFREEARDLIRRCVNAGPQDAVVFCGSGATGAIHKLLGVLEVHRKRTVVLYGPFEHHSNMLPWKESVTRCVRVPENAEGGVSLDFLEKRLQEFSGACDLLIGAFSAASNVTGILTDTGAVTALLHAYGAIAVWDFACAGPYARIDVNSGPDTYFDAAVMSPHKFLGGPGTPGLLVAKKRLFGNAIPHQAGGGTVIFVTKDRHRYEADIEVREEGGTPAIIDCIRCGLVFQLKSRIGEATIHEREAELVSWAWQVFPGIKNLVVLGSRLLPRLPIFSFLVRHRETGRFVHHNFIATLLNDLYGIQCRAGCACAGPYAADLLGLDDRMTDKFTFFLDGRSSSHLEIFKPGFVRVNLPFFYNDQIIAYAFKAIEMVSSHGWKLLPEYDFDTATGSWRHRSFHGRLHSLKECHFAFSDILDAATARQAADAALMMEACQKSLSSTAKRAEFVLLSAADRLKKETQDKQLQSQPEDQLPNLLSTEEAKMLWFVLPHEAADILCRQN